MLFRKPMSDTRINAWPEAMPDTPPVPPAYRGVWTRTLLETPYSRDDTTVVRWMQLGRWHADLRIPAAARVDRLVGGLSNDSPEQLALLATQQGFCGVSQVIRTAAGEVCTWLRLVDYQPPGPHPDAGLMVFESPDCVIETGVHGVYREIWQRLPNSTGRQIALAEREGTDDLAPARLFGAGQYLMRVRPGMQAGPDFEISFGLVAAGRWQIQHSTQPGLEGQSLAFSVQRCGKTARVQGDLGAAQWDILEWEDAPGPAPGS